MAHHIYALHVVQRVPLVQDATAYVALVHVALVHVALLHCCIVAYVKETVSLNGRDVLGILDECKNGEELGPAPTPA
jgi:hypothetical protein